MVISIFGKIFKSSFLTNLFEDINIVHIIYKSSQICGTKTQNVFYFGTKGVVSKLLGQMPSNFDRS